MKTFQEFLELVERYYEPDEKLPSGKTPYQKASASYDKQKEKYYDKPEDQRSLKHSRRLTKQITRINQKVRHGADNPHFNAYKDLSGEVNVSGDENYSMTVKHPKSGVRFDIYNTGRKTRDGKPVHDVDWNHNQDTQSLSDSERRRIVSSAKDIWTKHISHRLPHGSVIRNFPISNYGSAGFDPFSDSSNNNQRYARAALYSRVAGFGERNPRTGYQFAGVGREPSPKQKEKDKHKKRTYPMSPDTETSSVFEEFKDLTPEKEERVKNRVGELARDLQVQGERMKELRKKPFGKYRPKVKKEKDAIVKSAKKKQTLAQNASDALIRTSVSREAKGRKRAEDLKQQLRDLGENP